MTTPNHPTPGAAPPAGPAADPDPRWTVLLVDDEPDILSSVQLVLERSKKGLKVLTASSGAEGLELLGSRHIDLLISDFKMPVMDGIEFLAKARELRPELPRVMFTAYADSDLARRAFTEAFVSDFLPKTLGSSQLVAKVEALLAEAPATGSAHGGPAQAEPWAGAAGEAS